MRRGRKSVTSGSRLTFESRLGFPRRIATCKSTPCALEIVSVSPSDAGRLWSVVQDRNAPQKHVWRAEIVLLTADGVGTNAIMRRTGKSKTCVWRWQERFADEGVDGLLRDKTRPSRVKPLGLGRRARRRADPARNRRTKRPIGPAS